MFRAAPLLLALSTPALAAPVEHTATGEFEVAIKPNEAVTGPIGLLGLTKTYRGGLAATSTGQMLGAGDPAAGTASYVVLEQVNGTLDGRAGGFLLQHSGWMHAKRQSMTATIAPGSGRAA